MREFAKRFYKSSAWQKCRASYIASVHGLCERCTASGMIVPGKIVHHKIYLNERNINDASVTLNHEHLEYLCQDCHNIEHMARAPMADGLRFDKEGNIIPAHQAPR
jgi:5-methylcytosine-specific restriction endonuclease McrA